MKSQLNKILIVTLIILFFTLSKSYSIEDVTEFTDAINEAREEFNDVPEASTEQSKIIDEALKEIDKATEYAQEAINYNNAEDAIKTLEFIEKTLTDVESIIPQEFSSDMSKMDISAIPKEDMSIINELSGQMKTAKEKKQKDYMSGLIEINLKGIDTASISEKLNSLGVNTIKLDLVLDLGKNKKIETWTKKDWADSYTGSILTYDGSEVVTDKEISSRLTELEEKFQNNTLKIVNKRNELSILNNQLNPIGSELESLNEKKSLLTSQYNLEISKLNNQGLSNLETQKSSELSEKLKNQIETVTNDVLQAEQKSSSLKAEILSINNSINEQILASNKLSEDINNLNQSKLELSDSIALRTTKINELKGQSSELSSNSDIAQLTDKLDESDKLKTQLTDLQSQIENKRIELANFNTQSDPLNNEIKSLNEKKALLTSQYNLELSKLSANQLSKLETQKTIELSEKLKNELENVTSEALKAEQQSALLKTEISSLNKSLNEQTLQTNKVREDINNLNSNKLELTETIALRAAKLNELKDQSSNLSSNSNITELTAKLEDSEKLKSELSNLQSQIENKNLTVSQKISQINSLNTELNPLADQINLLKENKENLQKQYNSELTNISNSFNLDDLSKSKELAENLNKNINSVTDEIKKIEASSSGIQSDISKLNFEINTEKGTLNKISIELANSQKELNNTNAIISSKELELDRLLNTDLAQTNQKLNQQLNQVSLQKDFIQVQFEKSIDLEVEALQRYHTALTANAPGDIADEIDFAMREVGVILDADPRNARAFDIEKYATYAGLSNDFIQKGINAVNNDDWDAQKNILKDITKALAKNPNWAVDVPSEAEFRVIMAEEKAIQEAAFIVSEGQKIQSKVNAEINQKVSEFKNSNQLVNFSKKVFENHNERMFHNATYDGWSAQVTDEYKNVFVSEAKNLMNTLDKQEFEYNLVKIEKYNFAKASGKYDTWSNAAWDDYRVFNTAEAVNSRLLDAVGNQAKNNLISKIGNLENQINEIKNQEISKAPGYNYEEAVYKVLDDIPTFDSAHKKRVNEVFTGINASWGYPVPVGDKAAALRAALGDQNDYEAYTAAVKAMGEIGQKPASEFMTGPYWEMSNVKAAAIVRSKKYGYVDDYAYINAYYEEPLQLNTTQRQEVEVELKNVLGNNNPKLNVLTKQANSLKLEIETNNIQLSNINSNISELENEISSIKSSEQNLKNQISKLNNDITSRQSLINGKNKSLTDLQKNLDPINNKISELEVKKNDLNNNIQNQINLISQNTKKSEEIAQKTLELENKLSKEILEIDQQINGYKKETEKLTVNISSLNNEILNLENEKPDLSNKISKINEELVGYSNVKAELSVLTAGQKAEVENVDIEINKLESELSNLKTSESQINQQLSSLSNELKSKEDIIKNNNVSISEIQKQIDPLNSQIETLENQKVSLNEQFNKDLVELSNQNELKTETKSAEMDKLKADFETQISNLNGEINNFESQTNELNRTTSALNEEIKSIEVETPQITNQIAKLNQDIKNFTDIKAEVENVDIEINKLESELSNLKTSESQINQQLSSLSNELKSKEDIIKNNNVSISEIQKQIDPLNSQIETLENQKVSLNEQFNKDFTEISNQIEQKNETKSAEMDKLKADFETQISILNGEINNFESQTNELNRTTSALNEEIKSIEVETPQITNQIAKLNQDIKNFTDIKANLAMVTAKNIGIKVDEKAIKSLGKLEGKALISIKGTALVRVVDEKMLSDQAEKFIDPISSFSLNTKIYTAEAIKSEVFIVEEITTTYSKAKAARVVARENLAAIEASPEATKEEIQAAEAVVYTTKLSEIAAGQSLVSNNSMATAVTTPQQTLENLRSIRNTPGADKWSVRRTEAAIKAAEAQIAGTNFNYEQAVNKIANDEKQFNVWRVDSYEKSIEAAKASGNKADLKAYTRRLKNFQNRLVDQQNAVVAIQTEQSNYSEVLNNVAVKSAALSGASLKETKQLGIAQDATLSAAQIKVGSDKISAYKAAKAAREQIDKNMNQLRSSGASSEALQAAETARHAALQAEIAAANVVSANTTAVQEAVQSATAAAQDVAVVAQVASAAAQEAVQAAQSAQQTALEIAQEIRNTPGMGQWDVQAAEAAIKAAKAEIAGTEYDLEHALNTINKNKAYEEAGGTPNQSGRTWDGH